MYSILFCFFLFCVFYLTLFLFSFFFNDTATTQIYTLSLHDALPICFAFEERLEHRRHRGREGHSPEHVVLPINDRGRRLGVWCLGRMVFAKRLKIGVNRVVDRKSTRLNSSHTVISYAVFCLKKKKKQ